MKNSYFSVEARKMQKEPSTTAVSARREGAFSYIAAKTRSSH